MRDEKCGKTRISRAVSSPPLAAGSQPEKDEAISTVREEMGINSYEARRNMTDEQRAEFEARRAELDERWPPANVADFVDHIDHAVNLIGIESPGLTAAGAIAERVAARLTDEDERSAGRA